MGSVSQSTPFGRPMREHFLFDTNFKNFNHGVTFSIFIAIYNKSFFLISFVSSFPQPPNQNQNLDRFFWHLPQARPLLIAPLPRACRVRTRQVHALPVRRTPPRIPYRRRQAPQRPP